MKRLLLSGLAVCASAFAVPAMAGTVSGTFAISIYQGTNLGGQSTDPMEQAAKGNPLLVGPAIAAGTYTGALDFNPLVNTIGSFFASGGGTESAGLAPVSNDLLSTANFQLTTLFVISGVGPAGISGVVTHDDGATLYQGNTTIFNSASPTSVDDSPFTLVTTGPFQLYYVEANGLPAVLKVTVPEPATVTLLGGGLLALGALRRRRAK